MTRSALALGLVLVFGFGLVGPVSAESEDDGFGGKRLAIEGNFVVPSGSLESHQPGPGLTLTWERPLSAAWRTTVTTGYLTLLTKSTPSFQMMPLGGASGGRRAAMRMAPIWAEASTRHRRELSLRVRRGNGQG